MEKIQNLLNEVRIISKKNDEILDATGGRFNMFRMCGVNHYENTHSAIIAEFLNPNGSHGLKSKLLECFLETIGEDFIVRDFNPEKSKIIIEHTTEEGRIDIFIVDDTNKMIIIENKIYANDQPEQLIRYDRYAKGNRNDYQILYLTLFGDRASEQSGGEVSYLSISYEKSIINWLEKCVAIASRFPIVRETIIQYINHLKQLTNQDMDTKNKEEITEVLSDIDNLRAAQAISQNYSATFNYIIEQYFNPKMEEFAKQKRLEFKVGESNETYVSFNLTSSDWHNKFIIGFNSDNRGCYYGIMIESSNYRVSKANRVILHENLKKQNINSVEETENWPFYAYFPTLTLETWENDIIKSDKFLNECKEKIEKILISMEGIVL